MSVILPTYTCFDDALDTLIEMVDGSPGQANDIFLVHGLYRPYGTVLAHAWVEWDSPQGCRVFFVGILEGQRTHFMAERDEYYAESHVVETTRYTVAEALEAHRLHASYGPWIPKYLAACLDGITRNTATDEPPVEMPPC